MKLGNFISVLKYHTDIIRIQYSTASKNAIIFQRNFSMNNMIIYISATKLNSDIAILNNDIQFDSKLPYWLNKNMIFHCF